MCKKAPIVYGLGVSTTQRLGSRLCLAVVSLPRLDICMGLNPTTSLQGILPRPRCSYATHFWGHEGVREATNTKGPL